MSMMGLQLEDEKWSATKKKKQLTQKPFLKCQVQIIYQENSKTLGEGDLGTPPYLKFSRGRIALSQERCKSLILCSASLQPIIHDNNEPVAGMSPGDCITKFYPIITRVILLGKARDHGRVVIITTRENRACSF